MSVCAMAILLSSWAHTEYLADSPPSHGRGHDVLTVAESSASPSQTARAMVYGWRWLLGVRCTKGGVFDGT